MRRMGLVKTILERGEIYRWITRDKKEETIQRILETIVGLASKSGKHFIALDNPEIPLGSNVTEEAAFRFTWRLLEEATFGRLPYIIVTLNEFTYKKLSENKRRSMAKIAQHFDIVRLEWSSSDIERAIKARLSDSIISRDGEKLLKAADVARTPRSAIFLFVRERATPD